MNVIERNYVIDEDECREGMSIEIDGKVVFEVSDGEPEDRLLMRDFGDCYKISGLLLSAYKAGKDGETFNYTRQSSEDDE